MTFFLFVILTRIADRVLVVASCFSRIPSRVPSISLVFPYRFSRVFLVSISS